MWSSFRAINKMTEKILKELEILSRNCAVAISSLGVTVHSQKTLFHISPAWFEAILLIDLVEFSRDLRLEQLEIYCIALWLKIISPILYVL